MIFLTSGIALADRKQGEGLGLQAGPMQVTILTCRTAVAGPDLGQGLGVQAGYMQRIGSLVNAATPALLRRTICCEGAG